MGNQFANNDLYVKYSQLAGILGTAVLVNNLATGGTIGSAATTVDIAATLNIHQTTAGQVITIPSPTDTTGNYRIVLANTGSVNFTVLGTVLAPGAGLYIDWNGSSWTVVGTASAASGVTIVGGKTFTVNNTLTVAGTDGTTMTFPSTSATIARTDAANTFTGVQTFSSTPVFSSHVTIEGVTSASATGTVGLVFSTSPTLITPTLGVALATSINGLNITTTTGTLTITSGKTLAVSNTITLAGTDAQTYTFPAASDTVGALGTIQTWTAVNTFTATPVFSHITVESVTSTGATGTGSIVFSTSPTLVTPAIGVATGTSLAAIGFIKSSGTAGIGYATGAGGTITQITSRTTGVILSKTSGQITLFSAAGSATPFSFTVTNTLVAATDGIIINQVSGTDAYSAVITAVAAGSYRITITDLTGTTTEQPVFNVILIKGVNS